MGDNAISPTNLRSFYSTASMYNTGSKGQGRTIGITNYDGYWLASIAPWCSAWGLPTPSGGAGSNVTVEIPSGDPGGKNTTGGGEGDLDIQSVLGIAPLCNLIVYDGSINSASADPIGVLTLESDDNAADIITESYGWYYNTGSTLFGSMHNLHLTMSAEGITYLCASGDGGTSDLLQLSGTPYPDIDPEILVVGGLTTNTNIVTGSGNNTILSISSQVGWSGSGGGWSVTADPFNVLPSFQKGTGVPTDIPYRLVPDVALNADPNTPFYIYLQAGELGVSTAGLYTGIGGTSAATPTFAGGLADCEQLLVAQGALSADSHGHQRFGRINDLLYSFNGDPTVFNDITSGNNGTLPNGKSSNAAAGWDMVTGWGQMIFSGFVNKFANNHIPIAIYLSPSTVAGGARSTATVTINSAAPAGGTSLQLASNSSFAMVPPTVVVPAGATTASFTVTTTAVTSTQTANLAVSALTSSLGVVTVSSSLTINPVTHFSLSDNPTSVVGGSPSSASVTLSSPAPAGGVSVALSSNNSSVTLPATLTIAAGQKTGTIKIKTVPVASTASITITATLDSSTATTGLTIKTPNVIGLTMKPTTVVGGNLSTGEVSLGGEAPTGGYSVGLTSSLAAASVPASVTVPAGATTATFIVSTTHVTTTTNPTITATFGQSKTSVLTINPIPALTLGDNPTSVVGGTPSVVTVNLAQPAPAGGAVVTLRSNSAAATVPETLTIAAGHSSGSFKIKTVPVETTASITVTGTLNGTQNTVGLTIKTPNLVRLALNPTSVTGGSSPTGTITLGGAAPAGGYTISLSSNSSSTTVPTSVKVLAGATSATFTVSTSTVATSVTATITATFDASAKAANLTITP